MLIALRILYFIVIAFLFYRMIKGGGCCGGHNTHSQGQTQFHAGHSENYSHEVHGREAESSRAGSDINAFKDPVCGMYVSKEEAFIRRMNGQLYYFCSENCYEEFKASQKI